MLKKIAVLTLPVLSLLFSACSGSSEITVAKFKDTTISIQEFEKAYARNVGGIENAKDDSLAQLKNFLDLYVVFKMKLQDAQDRGFDNYPDLREELVSYEKQVGPTYLLEKRLVEPAVKDMYEKRLWEYRVSHIMIRPDSSNSPLPAQKADSLLNLIKQGASFEKLAQENSEDYFSRPLGGDIFYLTYGMIVPEFEDAYYTLEAGQVYPTVFKSDFGYHVIKVTEKRPRIFQVHAAHILVDNLNAVGQVDTAYAMAVLDTIQRKIRTGEDFGKLAEQYSKDPGSARNGGDLGFFGRRQMVQPFDEAAFNLQNPGDVSGVVKSDFGFHLIKLIEKKAVPTYAEEEANLRKAFQNQRYNKALETFVDGIKSSRGFKVDSALVAYVVKKDIKSGDHYMTSDLRNEIKDKAVFSFANPAFTMTFDSLNANMMRTFEFSATALTQDLMTRAINKFAQDKAMEFEAGDLRKTDANYAQLMEEYRNGVFIFKLQELEVWNKITLDSAKIHQFWSERKDDYFWSTDRVEYSEIFTRSDSLSKHYKKLIDAGESFDSVASRYSEKVNAKKNNGYQGWMPVDQSVLTQATTNMNIGEVSNPIPNSNGFSVIKVIAKDKPRKKTFEEARPEVSGHFQEFESKRLESEYNERLRSTFRPEQYYDILLSAFKERK